MFGVAVVLVVPAIGLLYTLAQRSVIEETAGPAPARAAVEVPAPQGSGPSTS